MKAEITGASVVHPERHRNRTAPRLPAVGEPYKSMTDGQKAAWALFQSEIPWLNRSHRALLQLACVWRARMDSDPDIGVSALQAYGSILSKLGATPVDETKVSASDDESQDPADKFFQ